MTTLGQELPDTRLSARLYTEMRNAPRVPGGRSVTLRSATHEPIDALIEDLSRSGFGMSALADLKIGSVVGLSVGGALRRRVRIVRRAGLAYGCEFLTPLSDLEVSAALRSGDVVTANFLADDIDRPEEISRTPMRKLSYLARLYVLLGLMISLWGALIYLGWRLL
jgi:hypothetical protein